MSLNFDDRVTVTVTAHVAHVVLNRADKMNALDDAMFGAIIAAGDHLRGARDVRAVVLSGAGRAFCAGLDLSSLGNADRWKGGSLADRTHGIANRAQYAATVWRDVPVPVIAAVHGYCIGGGVDLICAADIRLAASDAIFSVREAKVAIVADLGTLQRIPKIVSEGHVAELAFTGKDISAERAAQINLVNDVVPGTLEDVVAAAHALAREIAANSPLAVQGTKAVLRANDGATVHEGLEFVARWNTAYLQSNDLTEAMMAFLERREPNFSGD